MTTVAVLGTGIMGAPMARNLATAGFDVRAWNRTLAKAEALASDGVRVCPTPLDAMRDADFVVTMLADADAVESVVTTDDALRVAAATHPLVWVQNSTVGIEGTARLQRIANDAGVTYVDAPVLGTKTPAERGQLTVLASGPDEVREQCQPLFDAVGSRTMWLGPAGTASRFKLVMNSWVLAITASTAEALALADGLGINPKRFLDTIDGGPLDVGYAHVKGEAMLSGSFDATFPLWGGAKDAGLIVAAGEQAGVTLRVAEAVRDQMQAAADAGHADEDIAAVWHATRGDVG